MRKIEEKYLYYGDNICVSEDNKGNLIMDFTICSFDTNKNGKKIKREGVEEKLKTLINMPLVGRLKTVDGLTDFTGHNRKSKYILQDKKIKTKTYLDTDALGTFLNAEIKDIDGKEFITGTALFWGRFENAKKTILERFTKGDPIKSSWELVITASHNEIENGKTIEVIDDFYFIGNCLLGASVSPAYDVAGVNELEVAEELGQDDFSQELSNAIDLDISKEGGNEMENENIEISSLTLNDIRKKVAQLGWDVEKGEDYWIEQSFIYPLDNTVYYKKNSRESIDEDYLKVIYSIDEENNISIVSKEEVKMLFVSKANVVEVSEYEKIKTELSEKLDSVIKLGETIANQQIEIKNKNTEISELQVFKTQVEEIQKEEAEKQLAEKREGCKKMVLSGGYLTESDIEGSEELQKAIAECDEDTIKKSIAEAVIKNNEIKSVETSTENSTLNEIEVSTNLNATNKYEYKDQEENPILSFVRKSKNKRR